MHNDLASSGSPYLHQHAGQPVAWQQWSSETRQLADRLNRPLFISIGYATCHWCHVMAHESFDDQDVANLLNERFIPVKIDREERPDVDQFYMAACQATGKRGGWPLTIVAMPDGSPFFAATYVPRDSVPGRLGLTELLQRISMVWQQRREHVSDASADLLTAISRMELTHAAPTGTEDEAQTSLIEGMISYLGDSFDPVNGGFGTAPKFPTWHHLRFALRVDQGRHGEDVGTSLTELAADTLRRMRAGGIWDHVGGGFHRYSTDALWHLPHFEKMLYDQAWALRTYAEAWAIHGSELFRVTSQALVDMLATDFRSSEGLFHAAWDADSEGEEGLYHTWTWDELTQILGASGRDILAQVFDIRPEGNYQDEATRQESGRNLLDCNDMDRVPEVQEQLRQLAEARLERVPPLCDRKLLADWNGMILTALATAARLAGIAAAEELAVDLGESAWNRFMGSGVLLRSGFGAETRFKGQLDDYAFLAEGYLALAELSGRQRDVDRARKLLLEARERLYDTDRDVWHVSGERDIPVQMTRYHDEAHGSGIASLLRSMAILDRLAPEDSWTPYLNRLTNALSTASARHPGAFTGSGSVLMEIAAGRGEMSVHGTGTGMDELVQAARRLFAPHLFLVTGGLDPGVSHASAAPAVTPIQDHIQICIGMTCDRPVTEPAALTPYRLTYGADER